MNWSIIFALVILLLLIRIFYLRMRARHGDTHAFQALPDRDKLAILKECLLNNPTTVNLNNLKRFCEERNLATDVESYRPFMEEQREISKKQNALVEDNKLFLKEAVWMDNIVPIEFFEAKNALEEGDSKLFLEKNLEGISRFYSDEKILEYLQKIEPIYPKAKRLISSYIELMRAREISFTDENALAKLRVMRNAWFNDLLTIEE